MGLGWSDVGRGLAAILTGGASEVAIHVAENASETASDIVETVAGGKPKPKPQRKSTGDCCWSYQLVGDFLLEPQSGTVWKYNKDKNHFEVVPIVKSGVEKSMLSILLAQGILRMDKLYSKVPLQDKRALQPVFDNFSKELKKEIKRLSQ